MLLLTQDTLIHMLWLCYVKGHDDGYNGHPMMEHDEFTQKQLAAIAQMEAPEQKDRH